MGSVLVEFDDTEQEWDENDASPDTQQPRQRTCRDTDQDIGQGRRAFIDGRCLHDEAR